MFESWGAEKEVQLDFEAWLMSKMQPWRSSPSIALLCSLTRSNPLLAQMASQLLSGGRVVHLHPLLCTKLAGLESYPASMASGGALKR